MEHTNQQVNVEAVTKAIAIMGRVHERGSELDMANWQTAFEEDGTQIEPDADSLCTDELEMHNCGSAACFAGWVAVSPEWKRIGGFVDSGGGPKLHLEGQILFGSEAIAAWLNIPLTTAEQLTCTHQEYRNRTALYGKPMYCISALDVIDQLKKLLH